MVTTLGPEQAETPGSARPLGWLWVIPLLSLVIRLTWAAWAYVTPVSDYHWYDVAAVNWLASGEYHYGETLAYRPPGHPAFLAAIYYCVGPGVERWYAAAVVQAVLGAATTTLLLLLARQAISRRVGAIVGVLHALWPTAVIYVPILASEIVVAFTLLVGLWGLYGVRRPGARGNAWAALAGLAYGVMLLIKPAVLFILPAWLLLAWRGPDLRARRLGPLLVCIIAMCVPVGPWLVRNALLGFSFGTLSTQGGYALWWGNNPRTRDGGTGAPPTPAYALEMGEIDRDRYYHETVREWVRDHPARYAALCRTRLLRFFGTEADAWAARHSWPTVEHDGALMERAKSRDKRDVARAKAGRDYELGSRRLHSWFLAVLAPLVLLALLLSFTRPRRFALFWVPVLPYVLGLCLTAFAARYRFLSDTLLLVPLAALLADVLTGSAELTPRPRRWLKLTLATVLVAASLVVHARGWDSTWYILPKMNTPPVAPASAPLSTPHAP